MRYTRFCSTFMQIDGPHSTGQCTSTQVSGCYIMVAGVFLCFWNFPFLTQDSRSERDRTHLGCYTLRFKTSEYFGFVKHCTGNAVYIVHNTFSEARVVNIPPIFSSLLLPYQTYQVLYLCMIILTL